MKISTIILFAIIFHFISSALFSQDSLYYVTSLHGPSNADQLYKTYGVGDMNGDGLSDFVITYMQHSDLYFGSKNMKELKPAHVFRCWRSAPIGDVNGDGITDIMTVEKDTANLNYPYTSDLFKIYFGGKELDTVPKFTFKFPEYYFKMLYTLGESIGDINGDGYGDFIIGCPYNWSWGTGFIYVFSGGKTLSNTPILKLTCPEDSLVQQDLLFGRQIVGIGDNNNDGFGDFLASASTPSGGVTRVYLYNGGNPLSAKPAKILTDPVDKSEYTSFGYNLANAGDLNKDGHNDFIITGGYNAFIYLSLDSIVAIDIRKYGGGSAGLGTGGDINGDGYNDLLVGSTNHLNSQKVMVGMANVFYGGSTIDTVEKASMEGTGKWVECGRDMCIPGDINGDGYAEAFVHEPGWPDYNDDKSLGRVIVYSYKKLTDAVEEKSSNPENFILRQNYPNPFNPATIISYSIRKSSFVELKVFDMLGREVQTLVSKEQSAGEYKVQFNASGIPSGMYLYRIKTNEFSKSGKMLLLK